MRYERTNFDGFNMGSIAGWMDTRCVLGVGLGREYHKTMKGVYHTVHTLWIFLRLMDSTRRKAMQRRKQERKPVDPVRMCSVSFLLLYQPLHYFGVSSSFWSNLFTSIHL
jgi:hypothetical protein